MTTRLLVGDALTRLREIPDGTFHTVVTSPPYWGLRDYGVGGQIGLEVSPNDFVARLVDVFREVRRVLRDDGTCWVNMGDSYCGAPGGWQGKNGQRASRTFTARIDMEKGGAGLKPKDLVGMPWRLAFALQADGWWLRQDIVWAKPNPMPESVRDRCTKAHEYVFLLSKSQRYYFDQDAIAEACSPETHPRLARNATANGSARANGGTRADRPMKALAPRNTGVGWGYAEGEPRVDHRTNARQGRVKSEASGRMGREPGWRKANRVPSGWDTGDGDHRGKRGRYTPKQNGSMDQALSEMVDRRNKRSVWTIGSEPFKEAHFATFPTALVEPCILAGTSAAGACQACGAPWVRHVHRTAAVVDRSGRSHARGRTRMSGTQLEPARSATLGWRPACSCAAPRVPCRVLDPFGGAGTTAMVADRLQRDCTLIELNPAYAAMARERLRREAPLLADVQTSNETTGAHA